LLSDREKFVLHFCCMATITRLTGLGKNDKLMNKMIEEIRKNRCRSIAPEDMNDLLTEVNEEMVSGRIMFKHLMDDEIWSMTGKRPNSNPDWRDMK